MIYKYISISFGCLSLLCLGLLGISFTVYEDFETYSLEKFSNQSQKYMGAPVDEAYDPAIASMIDFIEIKAFIRNDVEQEALQGIEIPIYIDNFIRKKFLHGSSRINLKGNWILVLIDILFPRKEVFTAFHPKDIVKSNRALCNQQAVLFQSLVQDFGFEYESVGFKVPILGSVNNEKLEINDKEFNHFASAVKVDENWYYFDSNLEPKYNRSNHLIYSEILLANIDVLSKLYPKYKWGEIYENSVYTSSRNQSPVSNILLIQQASKLLSYFFWIIFLAISFLFYKLHKIKSY